MGQARLASWEVFDEFWSPVVASLLPPIPGTDESQQYEGGRVDLIVDHCRDQKKRYEPAPVQFPGILRAVV